MPQAPLIAGQLPLNYCYPSSAQQFVNDIMEVSHAEVPDNVTGVSFGPSNPGPAAHNAPWFNTNFGRLYYWQDGQWISRYPWPNSPSVKMLFEGTEADLLALDDPDPAGLVTGAELTTGPFWTIDHNYDGRFPMGPGLLPLANVTKLIGQPGGADQRTLDIKNVPSHRHSITLGTANADSYLTAEASEEGRLRVSSGDHLSFEQVANTVVARTRATGGDPAAPVPYATPMAFDTMPPYRPCFIAQRTLRLYWVIP